MKKLTSEFNAISLTRKEVFQIELPAIPSAGYMWSLEIAGEGRVLSAQTVAAGNGAMMIGGSMKQIFTLVADKPGTLVVNATYKRPWEDKAADRQTFTITVK